MTTENNHMTIISEEGEVEVEILLTFDYEETGKSYVLFSEVGDEENVYAFSYDKDGNLEPIETEEEWNFCEEVLNAFEDEVNQDDNEE